MRAAITALGAITAVGHGAEPACAAIHAGISRPSKVPGFEVMDEDSQEALPLIGFPVQGYTEGFHLIGRWMRLARGCVGDLLEHPGTPAPSDRPAWERAGLVAVLPAPDEQVLLCERDQVPEWLREDYLLPLHRALGLPLEPRGLELLPLGHAGTAAAVQLGLQRLREATWERLLIIAVDSLLDPLLLESLAEYGRLKSSEAPTGLMPGEAGVALLLESESAARRRGAAALSVVAGVATGREEHSWLSETPSAGRALGDCILGALRHVWPSQPFEGDIYCDLNGEEWRAREWGCMLTRVANRWRQPRLHLPCNSVGDTGAASGALGLLLATHSFNRSHDRRTHALVVSRSEPGEAGCVALVPP